MKKVLSALERQLKIEQGKVSKRKMMVETSGSVIHSESLPTVIDGYVEELKDVITLVKNRIQIATILGKKVDLDFSEDVKTYWKSLETNKPICTEKGEWDGLKSSELLCKTSKGGYFVGVAYEVGDEMEFYTMIDEFIISNVIEWMDVPI